MKTYSDLIKLGTYDERLEYLRCYSVVGKETFGGERYLNQMFYRSHEWLHAKTQAILRDNGLDLAIPGLTILDRVVVHHIDPITLEDISEGSNKLIDPENLICCSLETHNLIHFRTQPHEEYVERTEYDTCPWKKVNAWTNQS